MRSRSLLLCAVITLAGCSDKKETFPGFTMMLPARWEYKQAGVTDTTGTITTPSSTITFNYSPKGNATNLIETENDYVDKQTNWANSDCYFCEPGVIYVDSAKVQSEKERRIQKQGITDVSIIKVEPNIRYRKIIRKINGKWRHFYPGADYFAQLMYRDSSIFIPIYIPKEIKNQNIRVDSNARYVIKTTWPKVVENGITGVFYRSKTNNTTLSLTGNNLSQKEQAQALAVFKTITLK